MLPHIGSMLLAAGMLAGWPWLRSSSTVPETTATSDGAIVAESTSRVALVTAESAEYRALAIPKSYKSEAAAPLRLLVFRDGLCVRDRGLVTAHTTGNGGDGRSIVMEETGIAERAAVAGDGSAAVVAATNYVSRVDITPGTTSTEGDTVRGATTLTLVEPAHPDGRWQLTLEQGRWIKELVVLPAGSGVAVTTFLPRTGPTDFRILDGAGRESVRVPETAAETIRVEASPEGGHVAAEMLFPDGSRWDRAVTVFEVARAGQWTYGWKYGDDGEPTSWTFERGGILNVSLASGTRRFDPTGRRR